MKNKEIREKIYSILETIYSGSNHIGDVYNNEAVDQIMQIVEEEKKEVLERVLYDLIRYSKAVIRNKIYDELSSLKKV